jgi:prepilin-type N-terminal cleavage/methylation domain-containing protein/prepilin-type processing-associated H-X9-DG protein
MEGVDDKYPQRRGQPTGFSLLEVLVVVAVIGLLLSVLLPALRMAKVTAQRVGCSHNLKQIGLGLDMYVGDNDHVYPCASDPVHRDPAYWLWMGRGWRGWIKPYVGGGTETSSPLALLCPEDRNNPSMYESTSYAYSMSFYHSPDQINTVTDSSQTLGDKVPTYLQACVRQRVDSVAMPSAKILVGEWASSHARVDVEKGWWNWQGARNFLFPDGHVNFLKARQINAARDGLPDANVTIDGIRGSDVGSE